MDKENNNLNNEAFNSQEQGEKDASNTISTNVDDSIQSPSERIRPSKTVQEQFSAVATAPAQKKMLFIALIAVVSIILYFVLFSSSEKEDNKKDKTQKISTNTNDIIKGAVSLPIVNESNQAQKQQFTAQLPELPPLKEPAPPEPPPAPLPPAPPLPQIPNNLTSTSLSTQSEGVAILPKSFSNDEAELARQKKIEDRRKSGIMVVGGGGSAGIESAADKKTDNTSKESSTQTPKSSDRSGFLGFGNGALDGNQLQNSPSAKVVATKTEALDRTLLQGKIVYAVLETAINTSIPGTLRAIVTRDTYAESGKNILIPKGSRLIGSYQATINPGQTRVNIIWDRLIRPDGIDIAIGSAGTDQLGRAGVAGDVDTKLFEKLATAFLVSFIIPVAASKLDNTTTTTVVNPTQPTTGSPTVSITGSPTANAINQGTQQFSQIAKEALNANFPTQPTITIDQGTRINILVQKDLVFPINTISNITIGK